MPVLMRTAVCGRAAAAGLVSRRAESAGDHSLVLGLAARLTHCQQRVDVGVHPVELQMV